jgi:hypothetical protein
VEDSHRDDKQTNHFVCFQYYIYEGCS